jgi:hypothetical protein
MIKEFATKFVEVRPLIEARFVVDEPDGYKDILKVALIEMFGAKNDWSEVPDPNCIHAIDDGNYQGTLLFVIAAKDYRPSTYWATTVRYGSCSVCDTYQAINYGGDDMNRKAKEYADLAMHMIQRMKLIASYGMENVTYETHYDDDTD